MLGRNADALPKPGGHAPDRHGAVVQIFTWRPATNLPVITERRDAPTARGHEVLDGRNGSVLHDDLCPCRFALPDRRPRRDQRDLPGLERSEVVVQVREPGPNAADPPDRGGHRVDLFEDRADDRRDRYGLSLSSVEEDPVDLVAHAVAHLLARRPVLARPVLHVAMSRRNVDLFLTRPA